MPNIIEIHDLDLPALEPYRCTSEVQLFQNAHSAMPQFFAALR